MADGKEAKKLRWKKSEKSRRIRRQELWKKEETEIEEIESRCTDVSCYHHSYWRVYMGLIDTLISKHVQFVISINVGKKSFF